MAAQEVGMLDSTNTEVLSLLPPYEGKSVLELGSGIGHLTAELAKKASQVLALDFFGPNKNESTNGHLNNVKFLQADDVTSDIDIPLNSIDIIFSNLCLTHLSDDEAVKMVERMVKWLKPEAHILFRESCSHSRKPGFYMKIFKECHRQDESGGSYELSLVGGKCIGLDGKNNENENQICWLWQKIASESDKGFQEFLDTKQYKYTGILRYERIFGSGFVSTGGIDTTREFLAKLDLKQGQKVLDVGCGIGGGNFYMASKYGVEVIGIDLSINMISLALERAVGVKLPVQFHVADCTKVVYPDSSFDVIYSRDTILHIQDKPALFRSFYKWLKPGGKVLITDYCKNVGEPSPEFAEYIQQRGYDLHDVQAYGQMLRDAGFDEVIADDRTDQFIQVLQKELDTTEKDKDTFINDFSKEDYDDIVNGWKAKLVRTKSGEQRWGLFIAQKH